MLTRSECVDLVGRRGLEPRTSAVYRAERCGVNSETPSVEAGVMWCECRAPSQPHAGEIAERYRD